MTLWTSAQPAVANYVRALLRDHSIAKDVLQETALVLFRRFAEYDGQRPFLSWALGIARFQVLAVHRDTQRNPVTFDEEILSRFTEIWADTARESCDRSLALNTCIEGLATHAKRLLRLRYVEDFDASEIARQIGGTAISVRVALKRIRDHLRLCIEKQLALPENPS